ncbi:g183 [Coccomyxa elongata]
MLPRPLSNSHTSSPSQSLLLSTSPCQPFRQGACRQCKAVKWTGKRVTVTAGAADLLGVLAFSALPFAAVQALADSDLGKKLQEDVEEKKDEYKRAEQQREKELAAAREKSSWYGEERPKWLGPLDHQYPPYLRGGAPGDYAYDPLQLARESADFDRYFEYELLHARWAMLGALGAVIPEVLQYSGVSNFLEARWWAVGGAKLEGEDLNYLGVPGFRIAGGQGVAIIAICQVLLMFGPEYARACGIEALEPLGIYLPGDKNYPGGVFDPLGLSAKPAEFADLQVKEIKNGRLALVAWVGFAAQAAVTRKGPVADLLDFAADPIHNNIFAYFK